MATVHVQQPSKRWKNHAIPYKTISEEARIVDNDRNDLVVETIWESDNVKQNKAIVMRWIL